ncbi:MAG: AAA family ATPase, partial [Dehalococcoidia bacterium]
MMTCPNCSTENPGVATFCMTCGTRLSPSSDSSPSPDHIQSISADFVGRYQEMSQLRVALEAAAAGEGKLVMLAGEPGIGKTRTAQELAAFARRQSIQVLWGRCYEGEGAPPYWPWVQILRTLVEQSDAGQVRTDMGSGTPDIATILPTLREILPDLESPSAVEPEQARFRLFDSVTGFLKSNASRQPMLLVLDDLHWADGSSLLLLEFVAQELSAFPMMILGTYRDVELNRQHPLAETLGELTRGRRFQRVLLRGLSQEEVTRFVEVATNIAPSRAITEAVHYQTEGNPLFLSEVVSLMLQEGQFTAGHELGRDLSGVRIPEGVREVIGRRLNRLSQSCNEVLRIASVVGREFQLSQLIPLVGDLPEDRLLDVLEEGVSAGVIEEMPPTIARYQFGHALIQETLAGELTMTRRVRLHSQVAETLERLYGTNVFEHAAELAYHFGQAESVLGPQKVVE